MGSTQDTFRFSDFRDRVRDMLCPLILFRVLHIPMYVKCAALTPTIQIQVESMS